MLLNNASFKNHLMQGNIILMFLCILFCGFWLNVMRSLIFILGIIFELNKLEAEVKLIIINLNFLNNHV